MGIGSHTSPNRGQSDSWITPKAIINALGPFDLDPCACTPQPWPCATRAYTLADDGLRQPWEGRVWLNPPYGPMTGEWFRKLVWHGNGTALVFARTETKMFDLLVWMQATGLLFLAGRLHFHYPDGRRAKGNSGGPSVLVAYGEHDAQRLRTSGLAGAYTETWRRNPRAAEARKEG